MRQSSEPTQLPPSSAAFFQEYDVARLDLRRHAHLIIERILAFGNRAEVRWLLDFYGRDQVRDWVMQSGARRLPWRRYHLWCLVFGIPVSEKPGQIWPY